MSALPLSDSGRPIRAGVYSRFAYSCRVTDETPTPASVPPGYTAVSVRTTFLEMLRNEVPEAPVAPEGCSVERWAHPPLDEYLTLFRAVGGPWGWTGRLLLGDEELRALLDDPAIEIYRLRCGTRVTGLAELERQADGEVEIVYFGLAPEFIARGLGGFLLRWAVNRAWLAGGSSGAGAGGAGGGDVTRRVWLHTCEYDHPGAVAVYQKAGFRVYDEHVEMEKYPDAFLARRASSR